MTPQKESPLLAAAPDPIPLTPAQLAAYLGSTFVTALYDPDKAPLKIGKRVWTLDELASKVGVVHRGAAKLLTAAAAAIGATSVKDLYQRTTPYSFASEPRLGATTVYVAFKLFESEGFDVAAWWQRGLSEGEKIRTFQTMKRREAKALVNQKRGAPRRALVALQGGRKSG